jgi:hypothetical protein
MTECTIHDRNVGKVYEPFKVRDIPEIAEKDDPWRIWLYFQYFNRWNEPDNYSLIGGHRCFQKVWKKKHNYFISALSGSIHVVFLYSDYHICIVYDSFSCLERIHLWDNEMDLQIEESKNDRNSLLRRIERYT